MPTWLKPQAAIHLGLAALLWHGARGYKASLEHRAALDVASKLSGDNKLVKVRTVPNGLLGGALGDLERVRIEASHFSTEGLPLFEEPERSKKGRAKLLELELRNFRLRGLEVESLSAQIPECRYDFDLALKKGQIRLSRSGTGIGEVKLRQEALEQFALAKFREIRSVQVRCDRGWFWIEGRGEFLFIVTDFRVLAKLRIQEGTKLMLDRARIAFDGLPVDGEVAQTVLNTLNPVVDLDRDLGLYGAIQLSSVVSDAGYLVAKGSARIPTRPQQSLSAAPRLPAANFPGVAAH